MHSAPSSNPNGTPVLYAEKKLAELLGRPRADLRSARKKMEPGRDFRAEAGKEIAYTGRGLARLYAMEIIPAGASVTEARIIEAGSAGAELKEAPLAPVWLRCTKVYPNRRLIQARFDVAPADGRRVDVQVKDNRNFTQNLRLQARPRAAGSTSYELVGRVPRQRGRF